MCIFIKYLHEVGCLNNPSPPHLFPSRTPSREQTLSRLPSFSPILPAVLQSDDHFHDLSGDCFWFFPHRRTATAKAVAGVCSTTGDCLFPAVPAPFFRRPELRFRRPIAPAPPFLTHLFAAHLFRGKQPLAAFCFQASLPTGKLPSSAVFLSLVNSLDYFSIYEVVATEQGHRMLSFLFRNHRNRK